MQITGEAATAGPVLATISGPRGVLKKWKNREVGRSAGKRFSALLRDIPAGGPYRLRLQVGKETAARSFLVGDVWLLSGQSNMQGYGNITRRPKPHPLIRTFSMRREWRVATEPLHVLNESPDVCHNKGVQLAREAAEKFRLIVQKGSGGGIYFAREMLRRSGVP